MRTGLKQGCLLSTIWFNLYINDLISSIDSLGKGIDNDSEKLSVLLYADDVILHGNDDQELQLFLDALSHWCCSNKMTVNESKSNVVHFSSRNKPRTDFKLKCGNKALETASHYTYPDLLFIEHFDLSNTAKQAAKSVHRAHCLLMVKDKAFVVCISEFSRNYMTLQFGVL